MSRTLLAPDAPDLRLASSSSPVWRTYGGGGLIVGGGVLLTATVIEWLAFAGGGAGSVLVLTYGILFVVALTVLALSCVALALGATGRDGIVRGSLPGRIALISYGVLFLLAQAAQLLQRFAGVDAMAGISLGLSVLQMACGATAAVVVARAGVLRGFARVALAVSVLVGLLAGAVAASGASLDTVMVGFCASAASIAVVGAAYIAPRPLARRLGDAS
jgi:hypothetical protein